MPISGFNGLKSQTVQKRHPNEYRYCIHIHPGRNIPRVSSSIVNASYDTNHRSSNKTDLNNLEQSFLSSLTNLKSKYAKANYLDPLELSDLFTEEELQEVEKVSIKPSYLHEQYNLSLSQLESISCKKILKDRVFNKINEEIIYLLLVDRYFKVIAYHFKQSEIVVPMATSTTLGLIVTPDEVETSLGIESIEYTPYLLALLRLTDTMVDFTTNSIIKISIAQKVDKRGYTISVINLKVITKLENGFKLLDLKNDSVRRKYDGLKYSLKKVNGVVYDLSLRGLVQQPGEVE